MKKLSFEYVKENIEKEGYKLLSKEYKNNITKLETICPKGHKYNVTYSNFSKGHRCVYCSGNKKKTYDYVKKEFDKKGITLLSDEYKNNKALMLVICKKCGYEFKSSLWKIRRGIGCKKCSSIKYTEDFVIQSLKSEGYVLISDYRKSHETIKIKCPKGHTYDTTFTRWKRKTRCPYCSGNRKLSFEYVKENIEKEGYKLLSKEYKNNITKLKTICPKGHKYNVTYGNFSMGKRCYTCYDLSTTSKQEKEVLEIVKNITTFEVIENDRTQIINPKTGKYLELDIWIPPLRKAIEFNGRYWHKDRKNIDVMKIKQCKSKNIDLLVIWDDEWFNKKENCIEKIKNLLEKNNEC